LAILALANILSYLDRIVVNLMVEPIKADLAISDTQFSLLQGLAFGLFYTTLALPIGRMVDTRARKPIIVTGVAVFSLFALASGLARGYWELFLARIGVGAGEASVVPTSYSLLADLFPPDALGRAIAVFTTTAFVGIGLAYIAGGAVIEAISTAQIGGWFGDLPGWRRVLIATAAPAIIIVPLLWLLLREPARRGSGSAEAVPLRDVVRHIQGQRAALLPIFAGFSMITMSGYASTVWTPALFIRAFGWSASEVGMAYGALYLFLGPAGALLAGWLSDRMTARGITDAPLRVAGWGYLGTGLFGGIAPLVEDGALAMALFAPAMLMSTMPYPMAGVALQLVSPNRLRGQVTALYMTVINLVGLGIGPLVVGLFNDNVFTGPEGVRRSLALINFVAAPLALAFLALGFKPYARLRASLA
jgi:MFS family permease